MNIALFYHCLFIPENYLINAFNIVSEQMQQVRQSGLLEACSEMIVGCNGGEESREIAHMLIPDKAKIVFHGPDSRAENLTLVEIEKWLPTHPDFLVCYIHVKGVTHDPESSYGQGSARWRRCGMRHCVENWRQCVMDLQVVEAVGPHWLTRQGWDHSQHYFAGNFWWARSNYLRTLPSIFKRERIKESGIASLESRYESEVWIGNGPRLPTVKDYADHAIMQCP